MAAMALAVAGAGPARAQDAAQVSNAPQGGFTLKVNSDLVLTNVVVRDAKTGELVKGLKQSDFSIYENGKEQQIDTFDFESVDMATPLNEATVSGLAAGPIGSGPKAVVVARPEDLRNHRLIVMFFDLTSMQPEDLDRSVEAAQAFLHTKMQPADLVALVSLGDTLKVDQDFTADKDALINEVGVYNGTEGQGFAEGATANCEPGGGHDRLHARRERVQRPQHRPRAVRAAGGVAVSGKDQREKVAAVLFRRHLARRHREPGISAGGHQRGGARQPGHLQRGYARPAGDWAAGRRIDRQPARAAALTTAAALTNNMNSNFASQEVMATLSSDTGGKAFFDSNDFAPAFAQVQKDTSAYYAIGFHSSNPARDGKYRKLTVKVKRPGSQARIPAGLLCAGGLQALRQGRPRAGACRTSWPAICRRPIWRSTWTRCTSGSTRTATTCRFRCSCRARRFRL